MSGTLKLTQSFSGRVLALEAPRIRAVTDFVSGPDAWGIARRPSDPDHDFPVAWVEYETSRSHGGAAATEFLSVLQSGGEVRAALADGSGADLHGAPDAAARLKAYLRDLAKAGVTEVNVYTPFGTAAAHDTWRLGPVGKMAVASVVANLEAGQPLGFAASGGAELRVQEPIPAAKRAGEPSL